MSAEDVLVRWVLTVFVLTAVYTPLSWIYRRRKLNSLVLLTAGAIAGATIGVVITGPEFDPPAAAIAVITVLAVVAATSTIGTSRIIDRMLGR